MQKIWFNAKPAFGVRYLLSVMAVARTTPPPPSGRGRFTWHLPRFMGLQVAGIMGPKSHIRELPSPVTLSEDATTTNFSLCG